MKSEFKLFVAVFFTLCLFWNNHIILNDEYLIVAQLESLKEGKLDINTSNQIKYTGMPFFRYDGKEYSSFAHALPAVALPFCYMFVELEKYLYVEFFFFLIPWIFVLLLLFFTKSSKYSLYIAVGLVFLNTSLFQPIYRFEDWAPLYSVQFTNILLCSLAALLFYRTLSPKVGGERAFVSSLFLIFATPIAYWSLTAKHHVLSILLTVLEVYLLNTYFELKDLRKLAFCFVVTGLHIWIRPAEGISMFLALAVFLFYSSINEKYTGHIKLLLTGVILMLIGYIPCAVLGYLMYNLPVPPTVMGNFLAADYLKRPLGLLDIAKILPTTLFGINGETFGLFTYSPLYTIVLISALSSTVSVIRGRKLELTNTEKYMLLSFCLIYVLQSPFLEAGIIITGVRDYRFYLPLYVFLTYFLAKKIEFKDMDNFLKLFFYFVLMVVLSVSLPITLTRGEVYDIIKYFYLVISSVLIFLFTYISLKPQKFSQKIKSEVLVLGMLPLVILYADRVFGYYTPYDVHFVFPMIDRFVEFLIRMSGYWH